jgi:hypothetical protein
VKNAGSMTVDMSKIIGDKIFPSDMGTQDDVVLILPSTHTLPAMTSTGTVRVPDSGLFFQTNLRGSFDGCNNTYQYKGRSVLRSSYGTPAGIANGLSSSPSILRGPQGISLGELRNLGYATGDKLKFSMWLIAQGAGSFGFGLTIPKCNCN